jgi:hypothetical protein
MATVGGCPVKLAPGSPIWSELLCIFGCSCRVQVNSNGERRLAIRPYVAYIYQPQLPVRICRMSTTFQRTRSGRNILSVMMLAAGWVDPVGVVSISVGGMLAKWWG